MSTGPATGHLCEKLLIFYCSGCRAALMHDFLGFPKYCCFFAARFVFGSFAISQNIVVFLLFGALASSAVLVHRLLQKSKFIWYGHMS